MFKAAGRRRRSNIPCMIRSHIGPISKMREGVKIRISLRMLTFVYGGPGNGGGKADGGKANGGKAKSRLAQAVLDARAAYRNAKGSHDEVPKTADAKPRGTMLVEFQRYEKECRIADALEAQWTRWLKQEGETKRDTGEEPQENETDQHADVLMC